MAAPNCCQRAVLHKASICVPPRVMLILISHVSCVSAALSVSDHCNQFQPTRYAKWVILRKTSPTPLSYLWCKKHEGTRTPGALLAGFDLVGQCVEMPMPSERITLMKNNHEFNQQSFDMQHAIVIGGSMAGLLAARVLSDHFERVTIIERDQLIDDTQPRKGVPQGRHVHALLAGGAAILR